MTPAIEIKNLSFSYPDGKEALRGITLAIGEGECVGLVGPNGSGKSTLLLHLNGLLPEIFPATPGVIIFGRPVNSQTAAAVRRDVGLLFQDPDDQLFCPTVYEDVAFGPQQFGLGDAQLREAVMKGLNAASLAGYEHRSPHHLSSGEKRRVCLAGVLACEPRVLALDEPTSNLDPRGKRALIQTLKGIPATKVIATHDLEMVVELCTRTILLDQGVVIADGDTHTLLGDEKLMLAHWLEKPHILRHLHPH
ncbi:MAG TPA: ABC transporter ATP-binding protein [Bacteroidota bacterium]|nr:ABC transporter ATP-binding protein [Bacteroidota bacterium]